MPGGPRGPTVPIHVGIDLGSASVKAALVSSDPEDRVLLERLSAHRDFEPAQAVRTTEGRPAWLAVIRPARNAGAPAAHARRLMARLVETVGPLDPTAMAGTGRASAILQHDLGIDPVNEFRAITRAVEQLAPGVRTLFEIGGETSRYLRFAPQNGDGRLGIADCETNGDCAAGTGAFLDQQAARLRLRTDQIGAIALATGRAAQIAGRCSVFAKTDMVHAQQRGFTPEEVVRGLCDAVARSFRGSVARGRPIEREVAFVGGVAGNAGVVRALERAYGWDAGTLSVPPHHASFAAIGAALLALDRDGQPGAPDIGVAAARLLTVGPPVSAPHSGEALRHAGGVVAGPRDVLPSAPPLSLEHVLLLRDRLSVVPRDEVAEGTDAYLGIDVGSVSTNLVAIDPDGRVLHEIYLRTDARPLAAVAAGLRAIGASIGPRLRVCGVGTTGSGRELAAAFAGADVVRDEITAHKTGAEFIDRQLLGLGVDTILEIGGQDAKFIRMHAGIVTDFTMNDACSAGTGSFLEERAGELGIRIENEFAAMALASRTPLRLGERCTVFMERDVNEALRRGAALDDVMAGLAWSVATNYVNRVVRGRRIGQVVFFQGGTAYNDAVAAALSGVLGTRIVVPPFNGVMGALGAALIARDRRRRPGPSAFRGFVLDPLPEETREFTCNACSNHCAVQRITIGGEHTYWGDKCSVRYRRPARDGRTAVAADLVAFREARWLEGYEPASGSGPVIGLPRCLSTYDWAPFWLAVFRALGARLLLSEPTTPRIVELGLDATVSEPCFPVQVAHGHVRWLLDNGADLVLVPNNIAAPGDPSRRPSFFCPWNQTFPFVARCAPGIAGHRTPLVAPTLWFNLGVRPVAAALREAFAGAGVTWRPRAVEEAVRAGFAALAAFNGALVAAGRDTLAALDAAGAPGVVLIGRPYNLYDRGVNLDLTAKLRQHFGVDVIGLDCLPIPPDTLDACEDRVYWRHGARLLAAASVVRERPRLHLVHVTNFKCGPDSFVKQYLEETSGRPLLSLQFDGHNNDAGMLTRCEAYLDSKGALS